MRGCVRRSFFSKDGEDCGWHVRLHRKVSVTVEMNSSSAGFLLSLPLALELKHFLAHIDSGENRSLVYPDHDDNLSGV